MSLEICADCGRVFEAGKYQFLCRECLRKRLSEQAKKRNLNKIGNEAYSKLCAERRAKNGL